MLVFSCPCGKQLQAEEKFAGLETKCPTCGQTLSIPFGEYAPPLPVLRPAGLPPGAAYSSAYGAPSAPPPAGPETSGMAVCSMILGIASFCCPVLPSLMAMIFGFVALSQIKGSLGALTGRGMALFGAIAGTCTLLLWPFGIYFAWLKIGDIAEQMQTGIRQSFDRAQGRLGAANNLKQIGVALHSFHDSTKYFPAPASTGEGGAPLLSWRVHVLPYLGHQQLYTRFRLDEPWDSKHNLALLERMPDVYKHPGAWSTRPNETHFQLVVGRRVEPPTPIFMHPLDAEKNLAGRSRSLLAQITDGSSNTILAVTARRSVPWTKPEDLSFEDGPLLHQLGLANTNDFQVLMADGTARSFRRGQLTEQTLRNLILKDDGNAVPLDPADPWEH